MGLTRQQRRAAKRALVIKKRFAFPDPERYFAVQREVEERIRKATLEAGKRNLERSIKLALGRPL